MRIIINKYIPFKGYKAMCIGPLVFVRSDARLTTTTINHEAIHTEQWKECLYVFFLIIYGLSFLWQLIKYRNWDEAYRSVCFEREAYAHQNEEDYLGKRERFAWA